MNMTLIEQALAGQPLDIDIVDMHAHLGRYFFTIPDIAPAHFVAKMDQLGINQTICSSMRCMSRNMTIGNDEVLAAMTALPGRILGYMVLYPGDVVSVRNEVVRCIDAGFTGIKLHDSNGMRYDDPAYLPAYEIAHEKKLPILYHAWGLEEQFEAISWAAKKFTDASFLLAHSGSNNIDAYFQMAAEHKNVYLETCFSGAPNGLIETLVRTAGVEKVVWGSDCLFYGMAQQLGRVIGADISDAEKIQILGENARRILAKIKF
ncbi:amidohydrolase [bacterium]|nr:amidohydrolase [bacterium]